MKSAANKKSVPGSLVRVQTVQARQIRSVTSIPKSQLFFRRHVPLYQAPASPDPPLSRYGMAAFIRNEGDLIYRGEAAKNTKRWVAVRCFFTHFEPPALWGQKGFTSPHPLSPPLPLPAEYLHCAWVSGLPQRVNFRRAVL